MKWLIGVIGLGLAGCDGAPAYTIEVQNIPENTARLEVAAYVGGALAKNTPTVQFTGSRESFTFGLNLGKQLAGDPSVSVAARREDGCILAVGTASGSTPGATNLRLSMVTPEPGVSDTDCKKSPPIVLSAIRRSEGPVSNMHASMLLYGWGFKPAAAVTLKSPYPVQCEDSNESCVKACPTKTTCAVRDAVQNTTVQVSCRTDCTLDHTAVRSGPALIELSFDSTKNLLQKGTFDTTGNPEMNVRSVDLLQLLSGPLNITLTDPDDSASKITFSESLFDLPATMK